MLVYICHLVLKLTVMLHASVGARATIAPKKIQQKSSYNTLFDSVIHVMGKWENFTYTIRCKSRAIGSGAAGTAIATPHQVLIFYFVCATDALTNLPCIICFYFAETLTSHLRELKM